MSKTIQFSAQVLKVESKVDRTLNVRLNTQELSAQDAGLLYDLSGKQIWCAFANVPLNLDDLNIPESLTEFKTDKTPSQRLRGILYRFWEQNKKGKVEWEIFYRVQTEKIIEYIKDKLS